MGGFRARQWPSRKASPRNPLRKEAKEAEAATFFAKDVAV